MSKGKVYTSRCPDNPPEWYWNNGLHDACIISVEEIEFSFDYTKRTPKRNMLRFKIDSKQALYDNTVKEIRFINYKILTPNVTLNDIDHVYWMADRLEYNGNYYTSEIDLLDFPDENQEIPLKIRFDYAETDRI